MRTFHIVWTSVCCITSDSSLLTQSLRKGESYTALCMCTTCMCTLRWLRGTFKCIYSVYIYCILQCHGSSEDDTFHKNLGEKTEGLLLRPAIGSESSQTQTKWFAVGRLLFSRWAACKGKLIFTTKMRHNYEMLINVDNKVTNRLSLFAVNVHSLHRLSFEAINQHLAVTVLYEQ